MYIHQTQLRVPYADTDQMGYMYYGNYAKYYEIARTEAIRAIGISYRQLEEQGYMLPVYENYSKYLLPALYDEQLTIKVIFGTIPEVRWEVSYEFYNEQNQLIHQGKTTLIFIQKDTRRICKAPQEVIDKMRKYIEQLNK